MQPLPVPPTGPVILEIRADWRTYLRGLGYRALIAVPLIVIFGLRRASDGGAVILWIIIGAAVLGIVGSLLFVPTAVQLTWDGVVIRRRFGSKTIARQRIAYGVYAQRYQMFGNLSGALLLLGDANRKRLAELSGQYFSAESLFQLASAIGLQYFDVLTVPMSPRTLDARHPGLLPYYERKPGLIGFVLALVIVAVVVVVVVAMQ